MKVFYLIIDLALLNVGFVWNALFVLYNNISITLQDINGTYPHSIGILST